VVGLAATAFVVLFARAVTLPVLDMKPDQLKAAAQSAESNLQAKQEDKDILAKLETDGVVDPGFVKMVDNQVANALKPGDYKVRLDWVTPEPGAGLIRDQPELIAPTELAAFPGRGGILLFALDAKGERVLDTGDAAKAKGGRRGGRGSMAMGRGMGEMGPGGGGNGALPGEKPEDTQRRLAAEVEKRKRSFAGKVPAKEAIEKEKEKAGQPENAIPDAAEGPFKEELKGKRWIALTAVIDNEQMNKNWLVALKNPAIAFPVYKRVDVERQARQSDGSWTDWAPVNQDKNYEITDNLTEVDPEEYVPETKRPVSLVDPLPFLKAGYWTGVHVARLVPADLRDVPKADANNGMGGPGRPGMGMAGGPGMGMPGGPGMGMASMGGPGRGGKGGMAGATMGGDEGAGGMGMGSGEASGPVDEPVVPNTEPALMIRSLDFTVEPDTSYRFRARVVVFNPNKDHTDINPGVDTESKLLIGPWSESTDAVTVPADVVSFAQAPEASARRDDLVSFQVVKWDLATGQTVVKNDDAGPGWIIGEFGQVQMPSSEGGGAKPAQIDFNSRAIVLDMLGGREKIPDIGIDRNAFVVPAVAMVVEPDGSVVIRSQAIDKGDEVRQDMVNNYDQAVKESGKKREPGVGSSRGYGMSGYGASRGGGKKKGKRR